MPMGFALHQGDTQIGKGHRKAPQSDRTQNGGGLRQGFIGFGKAQSHHMGAGMLTVERSEEHTSELQSLMRSSYAVFCLKQKHTTRQPHHNYNRTQVRTNS